MVGAMLNVPFSSVMVLLLVCCYSVHGAVPASERATLMQIYAENGGSSWKNATHWNQGDPCENKWFGVRCDGSNSHVIEFFPNPRYSGNELVGTFPAAITALTRLQQVYLSNDRTSSKLTGTIPESIGTLTELQCFYVSHSYLSGQLPASFAQLTQLQGLYVRLNQFTGPFPDLSRLKDLQHLWFDFNGGITGSIDALGQLTQLGVVRGTFNKLNGTLPAALCALGDKCSMSFNDFDCPLPSEGCCSVKHCGQIPIPSRKGAFAEPEREDDSETDSIVCHPQ
jgi:hypothetical protein